MRNDDVIAAPLEYDPAVFHSAASDRLLAHFLSDSTLYPPALRLTLIELLVRLRLGAEVYITPMLGECEP